MSGNGNLLLLLGMLVLIAAGALMPQGAGYLMDRALEVLTDSRPLDGVRLTLRKDGEVRQALSALAAQHTMIGLREGWGLTQEEAEAAARQAVALLLREGLLSGPSLEKMNATMTPLVVIPTVQSDSSVTVLPEELRDGTCVVWECMFTGPGGESYFARLDDATGKLISVRYDEGGYMSASLERGGTSRQEQAERWASFFQDYFDADTSAVREAFSRDADGLFELEFRWGREADGIRLTF